MVIASNGLKKRGVPTDQIADIEAGVNRALVRRPLLYVVIEWDPVQDAPALRMPSLKDPRPGVEEWLVIRNGDEAERQLVGYIAALERRDREKNEA